MPNMNDQAVVPNQAVAEPEEVAPTAPAEDVKEITAVYSVKIDKITVHLDKDEILISVPGESFAAGVEHEHVKDFRDGVLAAAQACGTKASYRLDVAGTFIEKPTGADSDTFVIDDGSEAYKFTAQEGMLIAAWIDRLTGDWTGEHAQMAQGFMQIKPEYDALVAAFNEAQAAQQA